MSQASCPLTGTFLTEDEAIALEFAEAVRRFPIKVIAEAAGETSGEAVKGWRAGRCTPGLVRSVKVGRRIPAIGSAIVQLVTAGETAGPEHHRLIAPLLAELAGIAASGDEVNAMRARLALQKFAAQVGSR